MKHALLVPPVGPFSDPRVLVEVAVAAETAEWDSVFVWDHVLRDEPPFEIADPWIALAAIAISTRRVRIGPAVTPLTRRRPIKLARETQSHRPVRRAASYDGIIPIEVDARQLAGMIDVVVNERGSLDGFDVAVRPHGKEQYRAFRDLGATWTFVEPVAGDPELLQIAATNPTTLF